MCHHHDVEALREYLREAETREEEPLETDAEDDREPVPAPADD